MNLRSFVLGPCVVLATMSPVSGQCDEPLVQTVVDANAQPSDFLGKSIDVEGLQAVAGAPGHDGLGSGAGALFVLERSAAGWSIVDQLQAPDGAAGDGFGSAVQLQGGWLMVGVPWADAPATDSGAVYVFQSNGSSFTFLAKLTASDGLSGDQFGDAIALDDNRVLIGAPKHDGPLTNSGAVYVFEFDGANWIETDQLLQTGAVAHDRFGGSVALDGDFALVGAPYDDAAGSDSGSVTVFRHDGAQWLELQELTASNTAPFDGFGMAVTLVGTRAVIGAPWNDVGDTDAGIAYVFERVAGTWVEDTILHHPDPGSGDGFGGALDADTDRILIGAEFYDRVFNAGGAFLFERQQGEWRGESYLLRPSVAGKSRLGHAVAMGGDAMLLGASTDWAAASKAGAVYAYTRHCDHCGVRTESRKVTSAGLSSQAQAGYSIDVDGDTMVVGAIADNTVGNLAGAVAVFDRVNGIWTESALLIGSDTAAADRFGWHVAIDGDLIAVGVPLVGNSTGAVYVYRRVGGVWSEEQRLVGSDAASPSRFGDHVAVQGNTILVGAPRGPGAYTNGGAAYVFQFDGATWTETQKLIGVKTNSVESFGRAVDLDGNRAAIGASNGGAGNTGSVFLYSWNGATYDPVQTVFGSATLAAHSFGWDLELVGDRLLVGSCKLGGPGQAYVFEWDGGQWNETWLFSDPGDPYDEFGCAVSLEGDRVLIGAPLRHGFFPKEGAAYLYELDGATWSFRTRFGAEGRMGDEELGSDVALEGLDAFVGAATNPWIYGDGAVYVYAPELRLDVSQNSAFVGESVTLSTCGGVAGGPVILALLGMQQVPLFVRLDGSLFDPSGSWSTGGTVPPGLSGLTATVASFGLDAGGGFGASNLETLTFL